MISNIKVYPMKKADSGNLLAFAQVEFGGCFVVTDIRVIKGSNGPFVGMPSKKTPDGEYRDVAFPVTKEFREELFEAVLAVYEEEAAKAAAPAKTSAAGKYGKGAGSKGK